MLPRWLKLTHCPLSYNAASVDVEMKDWMQSDWRKSLWSHRGDDDPSSLSDMYQRSEEEKCSKDV